MEEREGNRDAYNLGRAWAVYEWFYSRGTKKSTGKRRDLTPNDFSYAAMHPVSGMAKAFAKAGRYLTEWAHGELTDILSRVGESPADFLPPADQGDWMLGVYHERARLEDLAEGLPGTLADARKRRGLTQARAAEMLGVSQQMLSAAENGRKSPGPELEEAMAELYRVTPKQVHYLCARARNFRDGEDLEGASAEDCGCE